MHARRIHLSGLLHALLQAGRALVGLGRHSALSAQHALPERVARELGLVSLGVLL